MCENNNGLMFSVTASWMLSVTAPWMDHFKSPVYIQIWLGS